MQPQRILFMTEHELQQQKTLSTAAAQKYRAEAFWKKMLAEQLHAPDSGCQRL